MTDDDEALRAQAREHVERRLKRLRPRFPVLRWFVVDHLRDGHLKDVSTDFAELAAATAENCVDNGADSSETERALIMLMTAKDHAVRAATLSSAMRVPGPGAGYKEGEVR